MCPLRLPPPPRTLLSVSLYCQLTVQARPDPRAHFMEHTIFLVLERVGKEIGNCKILCWGSPHTHTHTHKIGGAVVVCARVILFRKKRHRADFPSHTHTHTPQIFLLGLISREKLRMFCAQKKAKFVIIKLS